MYIQPIQETFLQNVIAVLIKKKNYREHNHHTGREQRTTHAYRSPQYMKQAMNPSRDSPIPVGTPIISPRFSSTNEPSSSLLVLLGTVGELETGEKGQPVNDMYMYCVYKDIHVLYNVQG